MKTNKTIIWFSRWLYFLLAHLPIKIFANTILFTAIFSLLIQGSLYYAEQNPEKAQQFIADYLLIDVSFAAMKSDFNLLYPTVQLEQLTIHHAYNHEPWLSFASAKISINLLKSLVSLQPKLNYFSLDGLKTSLSRDNSGNIYLANTLLKGQQTKGKKLDKPQSNSLNWLLRQKNISLSHGEIRLTDERTGIKDFLLKDINISLKNSWWHHQLSISAGNPNEFDELKLIMKFEGSIHKIYDWQGDFYIAIDGLNFQQDKRRLLYQIYQKYLTGQQHALQSAHINSQIWGKIEQGQLKSISGQLKNTQLVTEDPDKQVYLALDNFHSHFSLLNNTTLITPQSRTNIDPGWHFLLHDAAFDIQQKSMNFGDIYIDIERPKESLFTLHSYIEKVQLEQLRPLLEQLIPQQKQVLKSLDFQGNLENIHVDLVVREKTLDDFKLHARLTDYAQSAWQDIPFLSGFSADFWINYQRQDGLWNNHGVVKISSSDLSLSLPTLFRDPWQFEQLEGLFSWQQIDALTWINGDLFNVTNSHLNAKGNVQFWLDNDNSPIMLIDAYFHDVDAAYTSHYLPVSIMEKELVTWLDKGIVAGKVSDGGVLYRGRLSEFPYTDSTGNMDIVFNAENVTLNYHQGWPLVRDVRARATFTEQGMWIESQHARVFGANSYSTQVSLNDYFEGTLKVNAKIKGAAEDGLKFLQQSKILSADHIQTIKVKGGIKADLKLSIPTDSDGDISSHLKIKLQQIEFLPEWLKPNKIEHIDGQLAIDNGFINAEQIEGKLNGETVFINISTEPERKELDAITQLAIDTSMTTQTMLDSGFIPDWLKPAFPYLSGKTPIHVNLLIPNNQKVFPQVVILSDLVGISSKLPKPMRKSAKEKLLFELSYNEDNQQSQFRARLGDIMNITSEMQGKAKQAPTMNRLGVSFGRKAAPLPRKAGIIIQGDLDLSEAQAWSKIFQSKHKKQLQNAAPLDFQLPIKFTMDRVNLPAWSNQTETTKEKPTSSRTPLIVKNLPSIKGYINSLCVADEHLGKLTLLSSQKHSEYRIEKLQFQGDLLNFDLFGQWDKLNEVPITRIDGTLLVEDIGKLTEQIGHKSVAKDAKVEFDGYIKWHGSPLAFDYKKLFGVIKLDMGAGYFSNIEPGVGRMLGLFNLSKITKRINLDFSDVSAKGFSFEDISADFLFNDGRLYTRDLTINSSIAQINIDGHLDLVAEEFAETVTIIPNISSGLTIAGAALGGPVGAAAGWLGHALVGKQVNKISQYKHQISGPWSEPIVSPLNIPINYESEEGL